MTDVMMRRGHGSSAAGDLADVMRAMEDPTPDMVEAMAQPGLSLRTQAAVARGAAIRAPSQHEPLPQGRRRPSFRRTGGDAADEERFNRILQRSLEQDVVRGPPAAAASAVEALPSHIVTEDELERAEHDGTIAAHTCSICLDTFPVGTTTLTMPCSHRFCKDCLLIWLRRHGTCPVCRLALEPSQEPVLTPTVRRPMRRIREARDAAAAVRAPSGEAPARPSAVPAARRRSVSRPHGPVVVPSVAVDGGHRLGGERQVQVRERVYNPRNIVRRPLVTPAE